MIYGINLWLLLAGLIFLSINGCYQYDKYYLGEKLTEIEGVVDVPPKLQEFRRGGMDRYVFTVTDYRCNFLISLGAFRYIKTHDGAERSIQAIGQGSRIAFQIRVSEEPYLQDKEAGIRVMGFSAGKEIIASREVEVIESRWFHFFTWVPAGVLILWVFFQVRRYLKGETLPELSEGMNRD